MKQWLEYFPTRVLAMIAVLGLIWIIDDIKGVISPGFQALVAEEIARIDAEFARLQGIESARIDNLIGIQEDLRDNEEFHNYVREKIAVLLDRVD